MAELLTLTAQPDNPASKRGISWQQLKGLLPEKETGDLPS